MKEISTPVSSSGIVSTKISLYSIQVTSAPSERIFSKASRIIEEQRTRLDPDIAGKLLFVAFNYNWYIMHDIDTEDTE